MQEEDGPVSERSQTETLPVLVLAGGTMLDATEQRRADVLVRHGRVVEVAPTIDPPAGATVLDAGGALVGPGFVDLHAHLREPGGEEAETVETGARAGALGGYTALVAMPNTFPPIDSVEMVRAVRHLARGACTEVAVAATITEGRRGERLAPLAELAAAGVRIVTDDGAGVSDAQLARRAFEYAAPFGLVVAEHCEDPALAAGGVAHEGEWSSLLGLAGIPAEAEEVMLARDLALAGRSGARFHALHVSTAGSLALLREARRRGVAVTAEVTPHHLALTDAAIAGFDPVYRVNPPLRPEADRRALVAAVAAGEVDAVATDHAPHARHAKEAPFAEAPPGMIGLETAFGVARGALAELPLDVLWGLLSWKPAAIAGLEARHGGPVAPGRPANLCVVDPEARWRVDPAAGASRSANTPYAGWELVGRARHTVLAGEVVVRDGEAQR